MIPISHVSETMD